MRLIRLTLVVLICLGMLVTVGAGPALACSCVSTRTRDFVEWADEIVAGTLVQMDGPQRRPVMSSTDPITYTVAVDRVYRGQVGTEVVFDSAMSGASCGLEGMVVDRRYVVFLSAQGTARTASLCGGTAPATHGLERAVERLTGRPTRPEGAAGDARSADSTPAASVDDEPARRLTPVWASGAGILGLGLLGGTVLLRRRRS